jgi:CelD/BcsL family acetyltransferase involved in cellulose biosynthesis
VFKGAVQADVPGAVVGVVEDARGFAALEGEWEELYRDSPAATPFQSWAWLYSWWESYGGGRGLRLVTVRSAGGLLVGVLPLMLERRHGLARLLFVGTGQSDYGDVIARRGWENEVCELGVRALESLGSWHVADLQLLRPDAAAWGLFRRWKGPGTWVSQGGSPIIEVKEWDELLKSLSSNLRSTVRRAVRRTAGDGLERKVADTADTKQAARRLVALHKESWQGRSIGPEHLTQRFEGLMVTAAERMARAGVGCVSEFWEDGEVVISSLLMLGRDSCGTYLLGASQRALQRYQWSSLYIWDAVNVALGAQKGYVDLLRGEEPYKLRWSSEIVPTRRLILARRRAVWVPYAGYHIVRLRAKEYVRSEKAPERVKSIADKYRTLRRWTDRNVHTLKGRLRYRQ